MVSQIWKVLMHYVQNHAAFCYGIIAVLAL